MKLPKRIFLTLLFPLLMFLVMWGITSMNPACYINGKNIFVGKDLFRFIIMNSCQSIQMARATQMLWQEFIRMKRIRSLPMKMFFPLT